MTRRDKTQPPKRLSSPDTRECQPRPETPLSSSDEEESYQRFEEDDAWEDASNSSGLTAQLEPRRPFDYFRPKVEALVRSLQDLGHLPPSRHVHILRLPGNPSYRMFQVGLDSDRSLVLRVARRSDYDIRSTTRMICWLSQYTHLPISELLLRNRTANNPLGRPWLMTSLVRGVPLASVYHTMSVQDRSSIAWQLAQLINDIASAPVPAEIGRVVIDDFGKLVVEALPSSPAPTSTSLPQSSARTAGQSAHRTDRPNTSALLSSSWLRLVKKNRNADFEAAGHTVSTPKSPSSLAAFHHRVFGETSVSAKQESVLFHPGLDPRNVYVQRSGNPWAHPSASPFFSHWTISGIVSWDGCRVVPIDEAFQTPAYLTDQPCTKTRVCCSGCICVANDDLPPGAVENVRQYFHSGLREYRSQALEARAANDQSSNSISFGSRIKHVFKNKTSRLFPKKKVIPASASRKQRNNSSARRA
ncbi:hypothetical protein A4X09_0g1902 [Tilletia walkeri]|uniref:Aminoglycoside phosphotransferase domain-containing protein n=1 Tax=Tilletia walkeri TaxID=117179 RepID=A0A8X7NAZ7_9BASI|nr:hypothetical protein A4X09_0g1902 [Tilletia walkeri]